MRASSVPDDLAEQNEAGIWLYSTAGSQLATTYYVSASILPVAKPEEEMPSHVPRKPIQLKMCSKCGDGFFFLLKKNFSPGRPPERCPVCAETGRNKRARMRNYMRSYVNPNGHNTAQGIARQARDKLLAEATKCSACGGPPSRGNGFVVHHCHETGFIDGIGSVLCDRCNRVLGQAGDDPDLLDVLAVYQRQFLVKAGRGMFADRSGRNLVDELLEERRGEAAA